MRRIFSRLPHVAIEHQRRRPLVSRKTQPQSRPGQRVQAGDARRVAEQLDRVGGHGEAQRRGSFSRQVSPNPPSSRGSSVPAATAWA